MSDVALANGELENITINISGERHAIEGFTEVEVVRGINQSANAFSFTLPWEATPQNRRRFQAYRTSLIEIKYGEQVLLTGIMEYLNPSYTPQSKSLTINGRSRSGILSDVSASVFEMAGTTFNTVASELTPFAYDQQGNQQPFKYVGVSASPDITGITVTAEPGQSVYSVLSKLAAAHGLWAIPQENGNLLFSKVSVGKSVADLQEGRNPIISVAPTMDLTRRFNLYKIHQVIDGETYTAEATDNGVDLARGPKIVRPRQESDVTESANFSRARGLIDSYSLPVTVVGWTIKGVPWAPGMAVEIECPSAMIYNKTKMMVRRATFKVDQDQGVITNLDLTFPEVYTGGQPSFPYPWSVIDG